MRVTNHPLVGQRVRLTGTAWAASVRGKAYPISLIDEDGDAVFFSPIAGYSNGNPVLAYASLRDDGDDYEGELVRTIYGSRSRNVDPLPYVDGHLDAAGNGRRFVEPYHLDGVGTDCAQCATRLEPREEYDPAPIHPVNPILAWFRAVTREEAVAASAVWVRGNWERTIGAAQKVGAIVGATEEHTEHARRVIERLARL